MQPAFRLASGNYGFPGCPIVHFMIDLVIPVLLFESTWSRDSWVLKFVLSSI